MTELHLGRRWQLGDQLDAGGFGRVFVVVDADGNEAVAKLVPKAPGAERELLFADLHDVRNVVPVIDQGEFDDAWVIVMPRADRSLRARIDDSATDPLELAEAIAILTDVAEALCDIADRVVHRDLKPANVLLLDGHWCLADFGISRYAEATTAPDTRRLSLSPPYAGPERWRSERATIAADVYSWGVMAYELVSGARPFAGPTTDEFRDQHLHSNPPPLAGVPPALGAVIDECLYKGPGARPTPANLIERLNRVIEPPKSGGLAKLQDANRNEIARRSEAGLAGSHAQSEGERRALLADDAKFALGRIGDALRDAILVVAPASEVVQPGHGFGRWTMLEWQLRLNQAKLSLSQCSAVPDDPWGGGVVAMDVVAASIIGVEVPADRSGYGGRGHSLWFCDAQVKGEYGWFETAFMVQPLMGGNGIGVDPFELDPGPRAREAIAAGVGTVQVAWPFTRLVPGDVDEFVDRWAGWFADGAQGGLHRPSTMPDRDPQGSWRQS